MCRTMKLPHFIMMSKLGQNDMNFACVYLGYTVISDLKTEGFDTMNLLRLHDGIQIEDTMKSPHFIMMSQIGTNDMLSTQVAQ